MKIINTPKDLPAVHTLIEDKKLNNLIGNYGAQLVTKCAKNVLSGARKQVLIGNPTNYEKIIETLWNETVRAISPSLIPVINLTGIVLHTNLGRAVLPEAAIKAMNEVARGTSNLEFDLSTGKRGDRHKHCEGLFCDLTGAEAALVVNNNAAAVLLTLNSLAKRKEVPVSRGELIEIGGSFRMPDIMSRAGCKLIEVGTTNRTHVTDFESAINHKTGLLMKVHTSNFQIKGFTKQLSEEELSNIARRHKLPFITDLGSGTLVDLRTYNLPHETTVTEALKSGADLVTFSGDKLLGGPQAGIIAGRNDLIQKIRHNPIMRAMRPDKLSLAALHAVLQLYTNPDRLADELPTFRWLSRDISELQPLADSLLKSVQDKCNDFQVCIAPTHSQVGSGALPIDILESIALKITMPNRRRPGKALNTLGKAFRDLPVPVIGRITDDALWFDLRCLENEEHFIKNLQHLKIK